MINTENIKEILSKPKGVNIEWLAKYKSENFWSRATIGICNNDAYIRLQGTGMKTRLFTIPNYKSKNAVDILQNIDKYYQTSESYPLGRNFEDCILYLVNKGMNFNYQLKSLTTK